MPNSFVNRPSADQIKAQIAAGALDDLPVAYLAVIECALNRQMAQIARRSTNPGYLFVPQKSEAHNAPSF